LAIPKGFQTMSKQKTASYTGNVIEFRPGDKVIQVYPVARPLIGLVVGSNKVEGKVYVNWNGRTMQVDPEEIQIASGTPFFPTSRSASTKSDQNKLTYIVEALANSGDPIKTANFHSKFEKSLVASGIAPDEADDIAHAYEDGFKKRLACNCLDPMLPVAGETVIVLNDGGTKPGLTGILIDIENKDAIVDLSSGWSPVASGSNLMRVPLMSVVAVNSPMREMMASHCPGLSSSESQNKPEEKKVASRGFNLFLNGVKVVDVFDNSDFKAWVQTAATPNNEVIVSAVVEIGGEEDPLIAMYPIFQQKLSGFNNINNKTDYQNAIQRVSSLIENCRSSILQYFRNNIIPEYVENQFKESLQNECPCECKLGSKAEIVVIHDLNNDTTYEITSPEQAKDDTDKSAAKSAFELKDTVTMGKVIAEYVNQSKLGSIK
jgi:hypothetical protein